MLIAEPYNRKPSYPTYAERNEVSSDMLIAYRNWRSTMSGHPECDGVIAVGRIERFGTLKDFVLKARGALSIQWSAADTVPGTAWTSDERRYPLEEREGESGPELVQALAVHRSGWLDVYDVALCCWKSQRLEYRHLDHQQAGRRASCVATCQSHRSILPALS